MTTAWFLFSHRKYIVALKVMSKSAILESGNEAQVRREIEIQLNLKHVNVLRLLTYFTDATRIFLVLEYAPGGELFDVIQNAGRLSEQRAANYVRQVASLLDPLKAHQCSYISSFSNKNMALFSPMRDLNDELHTLQTGKQPNYIERLAKPVPALPILEVHLSHLGCIQNVPQYYEDGLTLNAWMMSLLGNELEDLTLMQRAAFNHSHILMHQRALAYACSFQVNEQDLMSTARTREPQALPYNGEMKQFTENLQKLDYDSS